MPGGGAGAAVVSCPVCLRACDDATGHPACNRRLYGRPVPPRLEVGLADVERLAVETVNRRLAITGVQRKLSLGQIGEGGERRLTIVGALGGTHILKPPTPDYPHMPELEHWTMVLGEACGLSVAPCGLLPLATGEPAFITRRFDREGERRIHTEDLCQLSGLPTADKYRSSMERAGALVRRFASAPGNDALRFFEVAIFSFLTGNSDMHLKNWSLVRDGGRVVLSPAYDLLPVRLLVQDLEESALPIHGRKSRLGRRDFLALAAHLKIPDVVAERTLESMRDALPRAVAETPSPWVPAPLAARLAALVERNLRRLA